MIEQELYVTVVVSWIVPESELLLTSSAFLRERMKAGGSLAAISSKSKMESNSTGVRLHVDVSLNSASLCAKETDMSRATMQKIQITVS